MPCILIVMTEKGDDCRAKPFVAASRRTGARQPARLAVAATPRAVVATAAPQKFPTLNGADALLEPSQPGESHTHPQGTR
jgi:hypothetical protein